MVSSLLLRVRVRVRIKVRVMVTVNLILNLTVTLAQISSIIRIMRKQTKKEYIRIKGILWERKYYTGVLEKKKKVVIYNK